MKLEQILTIMKFQLFFFLKSHLNPNLSISGALHRELSLSYHLLNNLSSLGKFLILVECLFSPSTTVSKLACWLHFLLSSDLRAVYILFLLLNSMFTAISGLLLSSFSIFWIANGYSSPYQLYRATFTYVLIFVQLCVLGCFQSLLDATSE